MEELKLTIPGTDNYSVNEAVKTTRTNIQFCGQDIKTIVFTSCDENEGKTTTSLHIAKSFADLGKRVLFIDSDMRKSVLAGRYTNVTGGEGLSEVLIGMKSLTDCIYRTDIPGLHILLAGKYPPNPVELLNGKYFSSLLTESKKVFDYIIIDSPPLGRVIDAAVIASKCDGTVFVLGNKNVRRKHAVEVIEQLKKCNSRILGVVRNYVDEKSDKYVYQKKKVY